MAAPPPGSSPAPPKSEGDSLGAISQLFVGKIRKGAHSIIQGRHKNTAKVFRAVLQAGQKASNALGGILAIHQYAPVELVFAITPVWLRRRRYPRDSIRIHPAQEAELKMLRAEGWKSLRRYLGSCFITGKD